MKKLLLLFGVASLLLWSTAAYATFNSGSTGALGNFTTTVNRVIALPPNGVLNYGTITIGSGATVTFTPNAANTPVYMLATGDVNIAGTINVNGSNATAAIPGTGGPGGFAGGYGGDINTTGGIGLGPGGGNYGGSGAGGGGGGGYGAVGGNGWSGTNPGAGGGIYGTATLLPIMGGSGGGGGGGSGSYVGTPGGGGGGAIVIASSTSITITGSITANGGTGYYIYARGDGGGGSGGAIRLVSNIVSGNGSITAQGGTGGDRAGNGGLGRIRIEAAVNNRNAVTSPAYSYGLPGNVFVASMPSLTITSVGGASAPASPTGNYNQPDILLPSTTTNPVTVSVSAANIPDGASVTIEDIPQYGTVSSATALLSGGQASGSVNLSTTYSNVVTAQATFTITAFNYNGEEIDKVRVAARYGGKSEITYITKSGKEIKGDLVAGLVR